MKWFQRIKHTLNAQLVTLSVLGISLTLALTLGANLWLNLRSNHQLMDRSMTDIAGVLSKTEDVRGVLEGRGEPGALSALLQQVAAQVQDLDVVAVLDESGGMVAVGSGKGSGQDMRLPPLDGTEGDLFLREGESEDGMERCAYAKVYGENGQLLGFVAVGVYMRSVYQTVALTVVQYLLIALVVVSLGGFLARWLARYIKSELQGYEPQAFQQVMMQRQDIWDALEEGVLAIDDQANVVYLNKAAREMLQLPEGDPTGKPLRETYPASTLDRVLRSGKAEYNVPLVTQPGIKILADRMPIRKGGKTMGAVAIFRNRTEVTRLAEDLTGVRHVVDALRANTHEFMNKLHVILGLLQLEEYKEAERYVLELTKTRAQSMGGITGRIQESAVAALLIGKLSRAQELRVVFKLDPASRLPHESRCLPEDAIISVLGNLIENAFDSFKNVASGALREVDVCLIEEEDKGLLIAVEDTGCGIPPKVQQRMFQQGFSTKGEGRGTGLALVWNIVQAYGGTLRVESVPGMGTTFTINIPVQEHQG